MTDAEEYLEGDRAYEDDEGRVGVPLVPEAPELDSEATYTLVVIRGRDVFGIKPDGTEDVLYDGGSLIFAYDIANGWAYELGIEFEVDNS